jgi:hypothetical protein
VLRSSLRHLAASCAAGLWVLTTGLTVAGAPAADDSWSPLGALPAKLDAPVFALAVDPADGQRLLAGTPGGALLRSADAGVTWQAVRSDLGRGVSALAFDPARPGVVLAGTRGAGVWLSGDGGLSWLQQPGTEERTVRAFAFAVDAVLAGTDQGVLVSRAGGPWTPSGLSQVRVSALAAWGDTVAAGGDASQGGEPLPLSVSGDAGQTWAPAPGVTGPAGVTAVAGSSMVTALAGPAGAGRPLLMGTNAGLFASSDRGATWQQLTGGGVLPGTDFTALALTPRQPRRLYAASDGGASDSGGLWVSTDGGAHFATLAPPLPEVTALAVSDDGVPQVVVATFDPGDHAVALWTYRDAGGPPVGAVAAPAPSGATPAGGGGPAAAAPQAAWRAVLVQPETPYVLVGMAALLAVVAAVAAYVRQGPLRR